MRYGHKIASIIGTMDAMKKYLKEYCVGCGLCEALGKAKLYEDSKGFSHPEYCECDEIWLDNVCPAGGKQQGKMDFQNIWGHTKTALYGWSGDERVRQTASSGGVITEIASWLLDNHKVDGIFHICENPYDATKTIPCISYTREALITRSGSRYAISHPLRGIEKLDMTKKYAFIGKPCDVVALRNYMKIKPILEKSIPYILSFFCAGIPSINAQKDLLDYLGCKKENLKTLRYRGDGWPGYATAIDFDGKKYQTDYNTSWGKILGRDIMKMCRVCLDGVGEAADIACGDAWYLTSEKKPDFSEQAGRNVIFARTEKGENLLNAVINDGKIITSPARIDELKFSQTYQNDRRGTMVDKMIAIKILGHTFPKYELRNLLKYGKAVMWRKHYTVLRGTILRIIKGKI